MGYKQGHFFANGDNTNCISLSNFWISGVGTAIDANDSYRNSVTGMYFSNFGRYGEWSGSGFNGVEFYVAEWVNNSRSFSYINTLIRNDASGIDLIAINSTKHTWGGLGTCPPPVVLGCTDPDANNYNASATAGNATSSSACTYDKPSISISVNPTFIVAGKTPAETSKLTWVVTDATSASINQGIGAVFLSSNTDVGPNDKTTYTLSATGKGGDNTGDVILDVYQLPQLTVSIPLEIDWGDDFELDVETNYADSGVGATYVARYLDGTSETIVVNGDPNSGPRLEDLEDLEQEIGPEINWSPLGPDTIDVVVFANGSGGLLNETQTITVNIDRLPDAINLPENREEFPLDEVKSPNDEVVISDPIVITDIDVPVEIKSSHRIQVRFDNDDPDIESNWKNVRPI